MTSYAVGILNDVTMGPEIVEYLERIDATLAPFDGHFIVHGARAQMLEGIDPGTLVVIEFPDRASAEGWYGIRPLGGSTMMLFEAATPFSAG